MRLGRLFLFSLLISTQSFAGYSMGVQLLNVEKVEKICSHKNSFPNDLCNNNSESRDDLFGQFKLVELIKSTSTTELYLSRSMKNTNKPKVLINFSKINHENSDCKFGFVVDEQVFLENFQESFFQNLSNGNKITLIVKSGNICELISTI